MKTENRLCQHSSNCTSNLTKIYWNQRHDDTNRYLNPSQITKPGGGRVVLLEREPSVPCQTWSTVAGVGGTWGRGIKALKRLIQLTLGQSTRLTRFKVETKTRSRSLNHFARLASLTPLLFEQLMLEVFITELFWICITAHCHCPIFKFIKT